MVVYTLDQRWAKLACDRLAEAANFDKNKIIFSDEAHFDLGGYVNKQNCRIWGTENPQVYIEKPTHPQEQQEAVTVNGDRYRAILNDFLFTKIEEEYINSLTDGRKFENWHYIYVLVTFIYWSCRTCNRWKKKCNLKNCIQNIILGLYAGKYEFLAP